MAVQRIAVTKTVSDPQTQAVFDDLKRQLEYRFQYGTTAPDSNTPGYVYHKQGATPSDPLKTYLKIDGVWHGG